MALYLIRAGNTYVISQVNQFNKVVAYWCGKYRNYAEIDVDALENKLMCHIYQYKSGRTYIAPLYYWEKKLCFGTGRPLAT